MSTALALIARTARLSGLRTALDVGGARLLFYTGLPPATTGATTAETLLGTALLSNPCGALGQTVVSPTSTLATLTMTVPKTTTAVASGVIGWVRMANGVGGAAGEGFIDLPAGLVDSGAPAILNVMQVFAGGEIQLLSCVLAE